MKAERKNIIIRRLVTLLLGLYLVITLSNIFFLSNTTFAGSPGHKSEIKSCKSLSYIERGAKAVFKENKTVNTQALLAIIYQQFSDRKIDYNCVSHLGADLSHNHRYAYLSYHILRI
jgi:hypothetical protein